MMEELHTAMGPPLPPWPSAAVPLARLAHPGMLVQCRRGYRAHEAVAVNPVFLRDQQCTALPVPERHD
jgi:hypothetical protein